MKKALSRDCCKTSVLQQQLIKNARFVRLRLRNCKSLAKVTDFCSRLSILLVLIPVVSLLTCGNEFLRSDFDPGNGSKTPNEIFPTPGTVEEDIPPGVVPIYIDTDEQLYGLSFIGINHDYPLDGYYILRGNGVITYEKVGNEEIERRIFHAKWPIGHDSLPFSGVFTGWHKEESAKTVIKLEKPLSTGLFPYIKGVVNRTTVSYLRIEPMQDNPIGGVDANGYLGLVAHKAENTVFSHITVTGKINVPQAVQPRDVYVGGIVGLADTGTDFRDCYAGAEIMLDGDGVNKFHAGGFAGILTGTVRSSVTGIPYVSGAAVSFGSVPITVKTQGSGNVYGGGIAGIMTGGAITDVSSNAVILVECNSGASYAGGFAGYVQAGGITNNRSTGSLSITAHSALTGSGEAYAGGIAGLSSQTLQSNSIEGSLTVVAKYYSNSGYAGGIAGKLDGSGVSILDCSITNAQRITAHSHDNPASPPGKAYAGGLVGYSHLASIKKSAFKSSNAAILAGWTPVQAAADQAAKEAYAGGLVGYTTGPVEQSYALVFQATSGYGGSIEARVTEPNNDSTPIPYPTPGSAYAGGIAGRAYDDGSGVIPTITESYAVATIKSLVKSSSAASMSGAIAGGLVGQTGSNIASAFAVAELDVRAEHNDGRAHGGGIAGIYTDTSTPIEEVYAAGQINVFVSNLSSTDQAYAGGLLGQTPATTILGVNRSVALQRYVASNAVPVNHHQIAGTAVTAPGPLNYRYENLRPQGTGTAGFPAAGSDSEGAGPITAIQAGVGAANPIAWYAATPTWEVGLVWGYQQPLPAAYPFPILKRLDVPPSLPSWAQIN